MRITSAALVTIVLGLTVLGVAPAAQAQPAPISQADVVAYEGTWVLDAAKSGQASSEAERRVITTGNTWMRVEIHRAADAYPVTLIYNLDGSSTINRFGAGTAETKLAREGQDLLLHTVFTVRDQPITVHELLPSSPNGAELVIDMMLRVEHGYQGVAPAAGRTPPNVAKARKFFQRQP